MHFQYIIQKRLLKHYIISIIVVLIFSCKDRSENKDNTTVITNTSTTKITPQKKEINGGLYFPEGFTATVVVDSIGPSRHIAVNTNGDIYAKLREPNGTKGNMALRDTTGNGVANIIQRFGDYPNDGTFATEMRIHNGYLYFSSEQVIYRQKLSPNQLIPEGKPEVILTDYFPKRWHNAKSLAFDKKGNMYVTFSAPTNACEDPNSVGQIKGMKPCPGLEVLGSIWRFDENKLNQSQQDGELYATGVRSMVAISWNDMDNSLYGLQHGRDYLHNHAPQYYSKWDQAVLPAEEFMKIEKGDDFGWPYSYYDHFKNKKLIAPEYGGDGKKEAKDYKNPIMGLPAHFAPNDLLFYKGDEFPERYKSGAFVAFHGSMNRTPYPQAGYIVAFIPFNNGKPTGTWEVFADGFAGVDTIVSMPDAKYRPMGLAEGADGSLYISESKQGKIWRVQFNGDKKAFGTEQLSEMESRKSKSYLKTPENLDRE
ncbi:Glucose/arabinose dehydrogenase, beta-propeller fold [Maribacter orientalis]|uniref:Glucose/arabinose dehydrogenase, beta-propeller fold n=1 Tax=Maribacter orientalis TaxID=228957 RepID=A0A1H7MVD9_9FLAO|nr:PQQ-dependent sugar dehydrogenase [Maribacter orientalis]SEL15183.1 Glucose/arabinose dehydrogenase, beta-propeller fold [Maribacter orientalis]